MVKHSTTDWHFFGPNWELDTDYYISSPSSVWIKKGGVGPYHVLLDIPSARYIYEGRIDTWCRWHSYTYISVVFRVQPYPSLYGSENYYLLCYESWDQKLYRVEDDEKTLIGSYTNARWIDQSTWTHIRYTWWNAIDYQNKTALRVRWEKEENGVWTPGGPDFIDSEPRWGSYDEGCHGQHGYGHFGLALKSSYWAYDGGSRWDDTIIYKA